MSDTCPSCSDVHVVMPGNMLHLWDGTEAYCCRRALGLGWGLQKGTKLLGCNFTPAEQKSQVLSLTSCTQKWPSN